LYKKLISIVDAEVKKQVACNVHGLANELAFEIRRAMNRC